MNGGEPGSAHGEEASRRRPFLVGLTGGIATGKSAVAALLAELGAVVLDADRIARQVVEPGKPALEEIARVFGPDYIGEDGRLRRDRLGHRVFADPEARGRLEAILHPRIQEEMEKRLASLPSDAVVVLDIPLLFETGTWLERVDVTLVVYADRRLQESRMRARDGLDPQEIRRRLAAQWPTAVKLSRADLAIYNQGSREALAAQTKDVWERILALRDRSRAGRSGPGQDGL